MANHFAHPASRDRPGSTGGIIALRDMAGPRRWRRHCSAAGRRSHRLLWRRPRPVVQSAFLLDLLRVDAPSRWRQWARIADAAASGAAREQRSVERQQ